VAQHKGWLFRATLATALACGCGGNGTQYPEAATGLAGTIGATALYRAETKGCWANCSPGYACARKTGLCRRAECIPACAPSQTCFIEADDRLRCVDVLGAGLSSGNISPPTTSSAPASSAVPPLSSASPN
jgi:hypothetical protein